MLIPLLVSDTSPARKARLLLGSSHEPTPGTITAYSSLAYSSEVQVSCRLTAMVLVSASTSLPPKAHRHQCVQLLPSPTAWPSAKPDGWPFALSALASWSRPSAVSGNLSKPASFIQLMR